MKNALVSYKKSLSIGDIVEYKRKLSYDHYFIFTHELKINKEELNTFKKFNIILCPNNDFSKQLNELIKKYQNKYKLFPFFIGESKVKHAVKIYNKSFNLKIDPKVFRLKHRMNDFLGSDVAKKESLKFTYDKIKETSYSNLKKKFGPIFILKPVNAASSLLNFRISSAQQYNQAKKILKKKYDYIIEEYLEGNLYSIDFFCNGRDIFLLCFAREMPFLELIEKLSPEYMNKYNNSLQTEFLHFLPIRYTLDLGKMKPIELNFIKIISENLKKCNYHGFIHLEYKVDRKKEKIGFIEWGARSGGKRANFIDGMHNLRIENIPLEILEKKDYSMFMKKGDMYFLKNRNIDKNFLMIYTSVLSKTHITKILNKIPDYMKISFEQFLKDYLWDNWKIRIKNIVFFLATSSEGYIYPFYERNDTRFNYIMEIEEDSFKEFLKKKHKILEHLVFHDYIN